MSINSRGLGDTIREQRAARRLSQQDLAAKANVEQSKLSRIERGSIKHPDPRVLGRIADVLGVSVELYYAAAGYPLPYSNAYPDPRDFFRRLYGVEPTPENLRDIGEHVHADYREWLEKLSAFTQESINWEVAHGLANMPHPWPLSRGELILYEWFQLQQMPGLDGPSLGNHPDSTKVHQAR